MGATIAAPADVDPAPLDPYALMAVLGKRVIHPGGRRATDELVELAGFAPGHAVLDVGCGVGTTAIRVAREVGCRVTAGDVAPLMLERARANVARAGLADRVTVEEADVQALPYPDGRFDRVLAEAVTMFVDRPRAAAELARVCRPGGRVLATEFVWRRPPSAEARRAFLGEVCPGLRFDSADDWVALYAGAGLVDLRLRAGPFAMMTPAGFLADEGWANSAAVVARTLSRWRYLKRMAWLMPRIGRAVPYLGYLVVAGTKPARYHSSIPLRA
jgi:SAM-dependent methyltransferase